MSDWIRAFAAIAAQGAPLTLVTVTNVKGSAPREAGAKMLVARETFYGTIGGGRLEELAIERARSRLGAGTATAETHAYPLSAAAGQCCGGSVELLFESLNVGPRLYVFGAGHVGQAIARTLAGTPFRIDLVDERPEWITRPELSSLGVTTHLDDPLDFVASQHFEPGNNYALIMTHRHDLDEALVRALAAKPLCYLGLIGSDTKWARFRQRLEARGLAAVDLARVRCPIGLALGGKTPAEIAISVGAELVQLHHSGATRTLPPVERPGPSP